MKIKDEDLRKIIAVVSEQLITDIQYDIQYKVADDLHKYSATDLRKRIGKIGYPEFWKIKEKIK